MTNRTEVECTHIEGELMRVRFAGSQLVSDHPAQWGGTGTGPAPGEMILMALTSATALAGHRFAAEKGLPVSGISSRATMNSVQEGVPEDLRERVMLPHLTYVDRFWRLLEFTGELSGSDRDELIQAMGKSRVEQAIRQGLDIDEEVIFEETKSAPAVDRGANGQDRHVLRDREAMPAGSKRNISANPDWQVSATALDANTCIVKAAGALTVVGGDAAVLTNPTPEDLLLAGLASCTTIYIARNTAFHDIPVFGVRVVVSAEVPADEPIGKVKKTAFVTGGLSAEQAATIEGFAAHCAFGLTLTRGAPVEDSVLVCEGEAHRTGDSPVGVFGRTAPTPDDPAYCTDGSCCVPALLQRT